MGDSYLRENCRFNKISTALTDYNLKEQLEIIGKGKEYFIKKFNKEPKIFVAGRWSLNNNTIKALTDLGFTHDCSVYPGLKPNWPKLKRICMPYKSGALLMVPISRMPMGGMAGPEDIRKYGYQWLLACFKEYYNQSAPLFHIALHSPAMTDPYYIFFTDKFLSFISKHDNINFKFVSEIKEYPDKKIKTNYFYYASAINKTLAKTIFKKIV